MTALNFHPVASLSYLTAAKSAQKRWFKEFPDKFAPDARSRGDIKIV